jgi:hypothetical protein
LNIVGPLEMLMKKTNDFRILVSLLLVSYIFIIEEL